MTRLVYPSSRPCAFGLVPVWCYYTDTVKILVRVLRHTGVCISFGVFLGVGFLSHTAMELPELSASGLCLIDFQSDFTSLYFRFVHILPQT